MFGVTPFDIVKVLESFVTAEPSFSKDIVKVDELSFSIMARFGSITMKEKLRLNRVVKTE